MNEIYFTSDTHFDHSNIIKYCSRPFKDVNHMNQLLITRWNETVPENGHVYHLGDFAFHNSVEQLEALRSRLNGKITLILGNHDNFKVYDKARHLFEDMVHIFNGRQVERHYQSDISLVLHPLPKVPILICYWKPDDGLDASLNIFFDDTAEENLPIESIFTLGTGLVIMFEKLALRHGTR